MVVSGGARTPACRRLRVRSGGGVSVSTTSHEGPWMGVNGDPEVGGRGSSVLFMAESSKGGWC